MQPKRTWALAIGLCLAAREVCSQGGGLTLSVAVSPTSPLTAIYTVVCPTLFAQFVLYTGIDINGAATSTGAQIATAAAPCNGAAVQIPVGYVTVGTYTATAQSYFYPPGQTTMNGVPIGTPLAAGNLLLQGSVQQTFVAMLPTSAPTSTPSPTPTPAPLNRNCLSSPTSADIDQCLPLTNPTPSVNCYPSIAGGVALGTVKFSIPNIAISNATYNPQLANCSAGGCGLCSGSLVGSQVNKQIYLLTARHCFGPGATNSTFPYGDTANWKIIFNYFSPNATAGICDRTPPITAYTRHDPIDVVTGVQNVTYDAKTDIMVVQLTSGTSSSCIPPSIKYKTLDLEYLASIPTQNKRATSQCVGPYIQICLPSARTPGGAAALIIRPITRAIQRGASRIGSILRTIVRQAPRPLRRAVVTATRVGRTVARTTNQGTRAVAAVVRRVVAAAPRINIPRPRVRFGRKLSQAGGYSAACIICLGTQSAVDLRTYGNAAVLPAQAYGVHSPAFTYTRYTSTSTLFNLGDGIFPNAYNPCDPNETQSRGDHFQVTYNEVGSATPGSSGSPLFNKATNRIIGTLSTVTAGPCDIRNGGYGRLDAYQSTLEGFFGKAISAAPGPSYFISAPPTQCTSLQLSSPPTMGRVNIASGPVGTSRAASFSLTISSNAVLAAGEVSTVKLAATDVDNPSNTALAPYVALSTPTITFTGPNPAPATVTVTLLPDASVSETGKDGAPLRIAINTETTAGGQTQAGTLATSLVIYDSSAPNYIPIVTQPIGAVNAIPANAFEVMKLPYQLPDLNLLANYTSDFLDDLHDNLDEAVHPDLGNSTDDASGDDGVVYDENPDFFEVPEPTTPLAYILPSTGTGYAEATVCFSSQTTAATAALSAYLQDGTILGTMVQLPGDTSGCITLSNIYIPTGLEGLLVAHDSVQFDIVLPSGSFSSFNIALVTPLAS